MLGETIEKMANVRLLWDSAIAVNDFIGAREAKKEYNRLKELLEVERND